MEYCSGGSLAGELENPTSVITWKQFISMSLNIVDGLNALHNSEPFIIHRYVLVIIYFL
jgi:serine/threonine protein kinase